MSEFEEIIEHLGGFGPYQVRVLLSSGRTQPHIQFVNRACRL